ncbi:MAG TPA: hypothetical protein ENK55_05960 [Actinobacteria bacterium]|nr:hypothetical protein [Actinomycetota bacterium]
MFVRRSLAVALLVALVGGVPVAATAQTRRDVEKAEEQLERAQQQRKAKYREWIAAQNDLEVAVAHYEEIVQQLEELELRIHRVQDTIRRYETEAIDLRRRARELVYEAYTSSSPGLVSVAFEAGSIQDLLTSQVLIDEATNQDLAALDRLEAVKRDLDRLRADLEEDEAEMRRLEEDAERLVERMAELFEAAERAYAEASAAERRAIDKLAKERAEFAAAEARRKAEQALRARANASGAAAGLPPEATPGFVCPVDGRTSFINSWGFPRSGGRRHKGTDMFAKRGTPVQAVVDGVVRFRTVRLGGTVAYVYGDDGNKYYYAHLDGYVPGIVDGQRVSKGTDIGYVGNSGNARYTSPHLHFEIRVGGTRSVNPYPTVRYYCR